MPEIQETLLIGTTSGQQFVERYFWLDAEDTGDQGDLVDDIIATLMPLRKVFMGVDARFTHIRARQVYPTLALAVEYSAGLPVVGTVAEDSLPVFATYSVQWVLGPSTNPLGSSATPYIRRGGKHLVAPTTSANAGDGSYNGSFNTQINAYIAGVLSAVNFAPYVFVVARQPSGEPVSVISRPSAGIIHGFGTQTTRKVGRGA